MTQWNFGYGDIDLATPLDQIKGAGWVAINNLHQLYEYLKAIQPGAIIDGTISGGTNLTAPAYYNNLFIISGALLSNPGSDIYVFGDCYLYSARLTCKNLYVMGNLVVQRAAGDSSYTNLLTVDSLHVAGNVVVDYTTWTVPSSAASSHWIGGHLTIVNPVAGVFNSPCNESLSAVFDRKFLIGGNLAYSGAIVGNGGTYTNANNVYGYCGRGLHFQVNGDIDLSGCTGVNLSGGTVAGYPSYVSEGGDGGKLTLSAGGTITFPASALAINASGGSSTVDGAPSNGGNGGTVLIGAPTKTGVTPTVNVAAGTGYDANGAVGAYTNQATLAAGHAPDQVQPVTQDEVTAATLEFSVPTDINLSTLQFKLEIWMELNPSNLYAVCVSESGGSHAGRFSGTKPYAQGIGTVTYAIGAECIAGKRYRWQVAAQKSDGTVYGLPSPQRAFVMA